VFDDLLVPPGSRKSRAPARLDDNGLAGPKSEATDEPGPLRAWRATRVFRRL